MSDARGTSARRRSLSNVPASPFSLCSIVLTRPPSGGGGHATQASSTDLARMLSDAGVRPVTVPEAVQQATELRSSPPSSSSSSSSRPQSQFYEDNQGDATEHVQEGEGMRRSRSFVRAEILERCPGRPRTGRTGALGGGSEPCSPCLSPCLVVPPKSPLALPRQRSSEFAYPESAVLKRPASFEATTRRRPTSGAEGRGR